MSDMNSNPHADESARLINADNTWTGVGYETADAQHIVGHIEANTQATLALAYEQRTANLFAYWSDMTAGSDRWADTPFQREMDSIQRDIRVRMGLAPEIAK